MRACFRTQRFPDPGRRSTRWFLPSSRVLGAFRATLTPGEAESGAPSGAQSPCLLKDRGLLTLQLFRR